MFLVEQKPFDVISEATFPVLFLPPLVIIGIESTIENRLLQSTGLNELISLHASAWKAPVNKFNRYENVWYEGNFGNHDKR